VPQNITPASDQILHAAGRHFDDAASLVKLRRLSLALQHSHIVFDRKITHPRGLRNGANTIDDERG